MVKYSFIFGANRSSHITYKHVWTVCATPLTTLLTTLHTQKKQNGEQVSGCSNDLFRFTGWWWGGGLKQEEKHDPG